MPRGPDRYGSAKGRYAETLTEFLMEETVEERDLRRARFDRFLAEHRQWVDSHPVVRMAERQCDELMGSLFIGGQFNVTGQLHSVFKTMETMKELISQKKKELIYIQTNYETEIKGLERELMSARLKIERDIVHKNKDGPCPYDPVKLAQMRALFEDRNPGSFPPSALDPPAPCDNLSGDSNNSEPDNLCEMDCSPENENMQEDPEICCQSCGFGLYAGSEFCSRCGRPVAHSDGQYDIGDVNTEYTVVESGGPYNETIDCSFENDEDLLLPDDGDFDATDSLARVQADAVVIKDLQMRIDTLQQELDCDESVEVDSGYSDSPPVCPPMELSVPPSSGGVCQPSSGESEPLLPSGGDPGEPLESERNSGNIAYIPQAPPVACQFPYIELDEQKPHSALNARSEPPSGKILSCTKSQISLTGCHSTGCVTPPSLNRTQSVEITEQPHGGGEMSESSGDLKYRVKLKHFPEHISKEIAMSTPSVPFNRLKWFPSQEGANEKFKDLRQLQVACC